MPDINAVPFQCLSNMLYNDRSERKSLLRMMWWYDSAIVFTSAIIWRTKALPAGMTVQAWCMIPSTESTSPLVQDGLFFACNCYEF